MSALRRLGLVVHDGPARRVTVARRQADVPTSDLVQFGGSGAQDDALQVVKVGGIEGEVEVDGSFVGGHAGKRSA